ncbi:hypothetical protein [Variovorax sp. Sphag1AA]|uniref:hypothetical protein n=1 Tax=Variovorax sp. Sphag1AA TaxID=2587027 RepID=UPI001C850C95|nr:hypothetical protein [Variovorax sp. Sphag1AA]
MLQTMRNALVIFFTMAGIAPSAWGQIEIADLKLGTTRRAAIEWLQTHYSTVQEVQGSRWQVEKRFVSATRPSVGQKLGDLSIREVNAFFNDDNVLSQVELKLDSARLEDVRPLIPQSDQATVDPYFGDTWEILREDGEIVFWVSSVSRSATVFFADKESSSKNVVARQRSNERFKSLSKKLERVADTLKGPQN